MRRWNVLKEGYHTWKNTYMVTLDLPHHLGTRLENLTLTTLLILDGYGLHYDMRCILVSFVIQVVVTHFVLEFYYIFLFLSCGQQI